MRVGVSTKPVSARSTWNSISANVIDYISAPVSGQTTFASGSVTVPTAKTLYAFAMVEPDGLCYPAGSPQVWPGTWP